MYIIIIITYEQGATEVLLKFGMGVEIDASTDGMKVNNERGGPALNPAEEIHNQINGTYLFHFFYFFYPFFSLSIMMTFLKKNIFYFVFQRTRMCVSLNLLASTRRLSGHSTAPLLG